MDLDKKNDIKEGLIAITGKDEAEKIWLRAKEKLKQIEEKYAGISKKEQMHTGFIFPCAAIQLAIKEIKGDTELGYKVISEYSWAKSRKMGAKLRKMSKIPGFNSFFVKTWGPVSRKAFGGDAGFKNVFYPKKKGEFRMDITACPYNRYFTELGTPELAHLQN